jgi:hypothetical protein
MTSEGHSIAFLQSFDRNALRILFSGQKGSSLSSVCLLSPYLPESEVANF